MTKLWDKYRTVIIAEYKEQNKPLREVQQIMREKHGFKASIRAYRSRFDRWGIHKYSRRSRRTRSPSPGKGGMMIPTLNGDGAITVRPSPPRQSPEMEESSSSPTAVWSNELLNSCEAATTPMVFGKSALYSASEEYRQLDSVLPGSSASVVAHMHEPVVSFVPNHFDARLHPFGPQCISAGGYSLASVPLYRQAPGHGGLDLSLASTSSSSVCDMAPTGVPMGMHVPCSSLPIVPKRTRPGGRDWEQFDSREGKRSFG